MKSFSRQPLHTGMVAVALPLIVMAFVFFEIQNAGHLAGGRIALSKLVWLGYAIYLWLLLPLLIAINVDVSPVWRRIFGIFFANMLARGCVELMMYGANSWSPVYGIGHDVFSILLLALLLTTRSPVVKDDFSILIYVIISTLLVEVAFVLYMMRNVVSVYSVYFVPQSDQHTVVLQLTWLVVGVLSLYLLIFYRRMRCGSLAG